jgi:hypothetical protein
MKNIRTKVFDFNNRYMRALLFVASLTFAIFLQFRTQILNRFSTLYGDKHDAVIVVTILEHWFNVLRGFSHWSQLNYFFPYSKTLGQTDGYFIAGVIYSAFRYFGLDPFLSSEFVNIAIKAIGFCAFFIACRKIFELPFWWSLVAASLFVLSNNATIHGQRLQLATVSFAPILAILMWYSYKALYANNSKRFVLFGSAAGIFLGAWSITCFYMTWFFIFFTTFFFVILGFSLGSSKWSVLKEKIKFQKFSIVFVTFIAALSLLPLLSVYLPKSQESGMRPYALVASNTVSAEGILQVGTENFMFGKIYNGLLSSISPGYVPKGEYYNTGIAPILFIIFLAGCVFILRKKGTENRVCFLRTLCIATIVTWILLLNFSGHSAWYFVYHFFPGAKALNVVSAYQIFLTIPVIVICINYLSLISYKVPSAIILLFVTLLCLEELNAGYISLNRESELKRVSFGNLPPPQCSSFFVTGWPDQIAVPTDDSANNYAHNVSAMLIAELIRLPTVNGIASFNPPDWNFGNPNNADYIQRIKQYAEKHQVKSLCKLNLDSHTWHTAW